MAFRVARGLFRLWLVLSVLWIGGVGVMTWQTLPSSSDQAVELELQTLEKKTPRGFRLPPWEAYSLAHKAVLYRHLWDASVLALGPPVFLLALGSGLLWAFRGFR
jgi:hypothetical protein